MNLSQFNTEASRLFIPTDWVGTHRWVKGDVILCPQINKSLWKKFKIYIYNVHVEMAARMVRNIHLCTNERRIY